MSFPAFQRDPYTIRLTRTLFGSDPRDGKLLRGASVLDYYATAEGGLGVVHCDSQGMKWRQESEKFLFPKDDDDSKDAVPEGSRFFVGEFTMNLYFGLLGRRTHTSVFQ